MVNSILSVDTIVFYFNSVWACPVSEFLSPNITCIKMGKKQLSKEIKATISSLAIIIKPHRELELTNPEAKG